MAANIAFQDEDWGRIEQDWNAWWVGELERPLVVLETLMPMDDLGDWSQYTKFGLDTPVDVIIDNWQRILEATRWHGDAYPKWFVNYGPGVMAAFQGSKLTWTPDTTWFWPLEGVDRLEDIHLRYDAVNPWWLRVQDITRAAVERWGNQVLVGITDIGGNLDVLASLRGSDKLLLDLTDASGEVDRLVGEITPLWLRYYDELYAITSSVGRGIACWGPCWSPGKGYMLQCDFSYMISPRMFKRFVMPDLIACCNHLDYGFYHMDGIGEIPHLDQLLTIERLRGIQWQPGDGQPLADGWLYLIAKIRNSGKRCQIYIDCKGALTVKKELGGKGFLMHIVNEYLSYEEAEAFLKTLQQI
jgi:5-methyltetrahydrofolate--homocysteine methyltransferase